MRKKLEPLRKSLLTTLLLSTAVSVGLLIGRIVATGELTYGFLVWNLFLGWLPLLFAWWLLARLPKSRWLTIGNVLITVLWLAFLPNAFYIASDLIHPNETGHISLLYDIVMFLSFTFNGFLLGYISLMAVQGEVRKRFGVRTSYLFAYGALFLSGFAIYLGRYLRWNSWDIIVNPIGLIFDVSEPFINPSSHPQAFTTTVMFFVLLSSMYAVTTQLVKLAKDLPE